MSAQESSDASTQAHLNRLLEELPELRERICRTLLIALHSRGVVSVDEIHQQARSSVQEVMPAAGTAPDASIQVTQRWDETQKRAIQDLTLTYAASALTQEEIDDLVNLTRKRDQAQTLQEIANLSSVSFGLLAEKVKSFCRLPQGQTPLTAEESMSTRVALIRRFISDQLEFIGVAKHYLRIRDFDDLIDRIIGSAEGTGLIGGKAGGMILGARILRAAQQRDPRAPQLAIHTPESFFLRSDVIEQFIQSNGLQHLQDHKYKSSEEIRTDFPMIVELVKNADFPPEIVAHLQGMLTRVGPHPLIVRSSSLLEDRFGTVFAGKYRSVFVCNQGTDRQRLTELLGAIVEVYASIFHPDPISYRKRHSLLDYSENMAVLIQKLVGTRIGPYFLPVWSGVGFSLNPYRRNPRVRPEDGLARVVFGLGTRAVDRVASDFPRMIPLGMPALRPEIKSADIVRVSQREVDVIDLGANTFTTLPLAEVLRSVERLPGLNQVFSSLEHGVLRPIMGDGLLNEPENLVITFDRFAQAGPYPAFLRWCLQTLAAAYDCPVDVEFACDGERFYLLQCRPQATRRTSPPVQIPADVPPARRVFSANRDILPAAVRDIEYVVLIDPRHYNAITTMQKRVGVAQAVRRLNQRLQESSFILMGPGRWGSKDLRLGVRVGYADINNTRMLIEIARQQDGYLPEVSFGSHFFQDLVESEIHYLALYPDEAGTIYNEQLLHGSQNVLGDLLPDLADYHEVVRVIHVPFIAHGMYLTVAMDGDAQQALAYLATPGEGR